MPKIHSLPKTFHRPINVDRKVFHRSGGRWSWLTIGVIVFGLLWLLFGSSYFKITSVQLVGTEAPTAQAFAHTMVGKNTLLLNQNLIQAGLIQAFPPIESVAIVRGLPRTLRLTVRLRQPKLIWKTGALDSVLDEAGYVFDQGDTSRYPNLPVIVDISALPVIVGQPVVSPGFILFVTELSQQIPEKLQLSIKRFEINDTTLLIDAILDSDIKIRFALERSVTAQLEDVMVLRKAHPDAKHIDVRVSGWGYWK